MSWTKTLPTPCAKKEWRHEDRHERKQWGDCGKHEGWENQHCHEQRWDDHSQRCHG